MTFPPLAIETACHLVVLKWLLHLSRVVVAIDAHFTNVRVLQQLEVDLVVVILGLKHG